MVHFIRAVLASCDFIDSAFSICLVDITAFTTYRHNRGRHVCGDSCHSVLACAIAGIHQVNRMGCLDYFVGQAFQPAG